MNFNTAALRDGLHRLSHPDLKDSRYLSAAARARMRQNSKETNKNS